MKIAIPADEKSLAVNVGQSFGRSPYFLVADSGDLSFSAVENRAVAAEGGAGVQAAQTVVDCGAEAVITFRCGQNAASVLQAAGIKLFKAVSGTVRENVEKCREGKLEELTEIHAGHHGKHNKEFDKGEEFTVKIAVASDNNMVSPHFGFCEGFTVYSVDGETISGRGFVKNPGHRPGFLPRFLHELGVNVIISGGMGANAASLFAENGIEVITGASGSIDDVVKQYLQGSLQSTGSVCSEHRHHGECHDE